MPDREKVIKGLECCADLQRGTMHRACDVCPYNDDPQQGTCVTLFPLFQDALVMLKAEQLYLTQQDAACRLIGGETMLRGRRVGDGAGIPGETPAAGLSAA